ncbi:division/cell wall cluster transcriptional repressor MraZ [Pelotomaculum propionicicum]|uniref:Transcriptional regulator MraZ n=1 Tax=Pelotomaculum propionicicum TaxID=258475 RepID=A0A4Y7RWQ7_9FIRM|nr:division/cell wall cluster transcriptional repressor MraZ [Pelotomaculum propionicicum]NLI13884.1 division/cell wall cluster transcriptional repressor MraZ [Peptococcaceae bacterium]TEB13122.1 Transcriptional regulator MraZ [Pelotomaculum propionicicum]
MFMGEYQHNIDPKGRLFIPARFREGLGDSFVITKGLDGCLFAYPQPEWDALEQKLKSLPFTKGDARAFVRFFFSGAAICEADKQGRILIPGNLREFAHLEKDVVVIGVSSRVEIWAKRQWDEYNARAAESYEEIAEKIVDFDLGI